MISMKAVAALALSGLGAASMANLARLEYGRRAPVAVRVAAPAPPRVVPRSAAPPPPATNRVVTLEPVLVYARAAPRVAPRPKPERKLAACSDWRQVESGPAGHGVRVLCVQ